jgi:hypothetical protein
MKTRIILFIMAVFTTNNLFGQTNSLINEIVLYKDEKADTILKGRKLTLSKFIENDTGKVSELLEYLQTQENDDYLVFYPEEKWLLYYWLQHYQQILKGVQDFNANNLSKMRMQIKPEMDLMLIKIKEKLLQQRQQIKQQIVQSELTETEKKFLALHFDYLLASFDHNEITQDSLNFSSNKYLRDHPHSIYDTFVRTYILYQFVPSKLGIAYEFFSGYGVFTDKLEKNFNNNVPIGVAFDFCYKSFAVYLRNYIGLSKTKDSILFSNVVWRKDAPARVFLPEASLGFAVIDNTFLKLAPFVGIASASVSPTDYERKKIPEYENIGLTFTTAYTLGLNLDLKLKAKDNRSYPSYTFIRTRYGYTKPQFNMKYSGFAGDIHYLTVGIGLLNRPSRRLK